MIPIRFVPLLIFAAFFGSSSVLAENLIITGSRADLDHFKANLPKKLPAEPLFTGAEQATLSRLGKTDYAATLLVRAGDSSEQVRARAKRHHLSVEADRKVKVKSYIRDPLSDELWGISNIGASRKSYIDNFTSLVIPGKKGEDVNIPVIENLGKGMVVAVLDSGFDTGHPDLAGQFVTKPEECANYEKFQACVAEANQRNEPPAACEKTYFKLDTDGNGYPMDCHGWSAYGKLSKVSKQYGGPDIAEQFEEGSGHGTKVAGVIAALANNGIGGRGIAPGVKILGVRVISEEPGGDAGGVARPDQATSLISTVVRGMVYAIAEKANVINLSLGWNGRADSPLMREAVKTAQENGIIVVAAAGNDSTDALVYPCQYEGVVCVGSHDPDGGISEFSNFGSGVDIAAPGFSILSTIDREADPIYYTDRQGYDFDNGTSFASPYVAGAVAILRSKGFDVNESIARLLVGARPKPYSEEKVVLSGNLDVKRAIDARSRPYFVPVNKGIYPVIWNRTKNTVELEIELKNIWKGAKNAKARLTLSSRDQALGQLRLSKSRFTATTWATGTTRTLKTTLQVLDPKVTSDATLVLEIEADGLVPQKIRIPLQISVVLEKETRLPNAKTINVSGDVNPNGTLFTIQSADGRPEQDYVSIERADEVWNYQIIREVRSSGGSRYVAGPVKSIPQVENGSPRTAQRIDVNLDGTPDYVFSIFVPSEEEDHIPYFRFDYRDASGNEVLPSYTFKNRTTVMQLDRYQWIRSGKRLVPAWNGVGLTPIAEKMPFDPWNPNADRDEESEPRLYYHDPATEDGLRSIPIPTSSLLPKDAVYLSLLNQSETDRRNGKIACLATEQGDYVSRLFAIEFTATDAIPKIFPVEMAKYRNLRSVESVKGYPLNSDLSGNLTAFGGTSGVQSQRVSGVTKMGEHYLLLDQTVTPSISSDTAYKTIAAFSSPGMAAFIQANYDILYSDSSTRTNLSTSLRRYTFLASALFERTFIPAVAESAGERLPAIQIPDGFGAYPGAEVIVPLRRGGVSVDLIRPAALRIQIGGDDCDWLARTEPSAAAPSSAVYFCGDRFIRIPYRF